MNRLALTTAAQESSVEALQARVALRIAADLSEAADALPHDITERLRFAREQALARARTTARAAERAAAPVVIGATAGGAALWAAPGGARGRWFKLAAVVPLVALVAGLLMIEDWNTRAQIDAAADVDSALLSDDLPPAAYSDPGFGEFLKTADD